MEFGGINFDTYFKNYPDQNGYFGKYGGCYVSAELKEAMELIKFCKSQLKGYQEEFDKILTEN